MRVLTYGATGVQGGAAARQLAKTDHEIVALLREPEQLGSLADLGIVAGEVATEDLDVMQLCSDELIVIAPVNHPLPQFKRLHFADLLDTCRFVGLNQFSAIQSFLDRIASGMGKRISLRIQVGSFDAVCRMVEAGAGIAIVPNSCARRYASRKVLRFITLEDDWAKRELRLVRRPGRELPQFAETLVHYLIDAAREPI